MLFACSWLQEREPWWFRFGSQRSGEIYPSPDGIAWGRDQGRRTPKACPCGLAGVHFSTAESAQSCAAVDNSLAV